jgi:outer membrane protein
MRLKRHAVTLSAALLLSAIAPTVYAQVKVAVVDLQRALNQTEDGRRAKRQLKRLFKRRQTILDKKQTELKKMKADISRQKNVLSRDALQKRLEQYQQAFVKLQTTYVEYQRELAKKEAQLTGEILEKMQKIVQDIGQAEGYTVILERNEGGVIWAPRKVDLTEKVIDEYNSGK